MGERKDNKLWQFDSDCRILSYYMGNDQVVLLGGRESSEFFCWAADFKGFQEVFTAN